jgi:hypothetical protein
MDKAQRKRRAVIGAIALLEWRDRMTRENTERENVEREMMARYAIFIAAMRAQAEEFAAPREARMISVGLPVCHGAGHAGAI